MTTEAHNLELERAADALARVESVRSEHSGAAAKYRTYARSLPADILQMGLGQALATLLAAAGGKQGDPHRLLYDHVAQWLTADRSGAPYRGREGQLIAAITEGDEAAYLAAQAEALAYLAWLKKFAVALLSDLEGDAEVHP